MLLRKFLSFFRVLRDSPHPLHDLRERLRENWFPILRTLHGGKTFRYKAAPGFPFVCVPASASSRQLFLHGYQEQLEAFIASRWLQAGDGCIDVGANVGYFSCLFAEKAGRSGKVIALEPSPQTSAYLHQAVTLLGLGQVAVENVCAVDAEQPVRFMAALSDLADCEQSLRVDESQRGHFYEVEAQGTTLDALVRKHQIEDRVSLVKIDVEGAEPLVLRGSAKLFASAHRPLFIVEIHQMALGNFQFKPRAILDFFPTEEFRCFIVPRSVSDATAARPHGVPLLFVEGDELPVYCNLIAVPRRGKFAERASQLTGLFPDHKT